MATINKAAVLNPFTDLTANVLDYVPRATTSEFGIVAIGSGISVDNLGRIYLDTQEYSDRLTAIEAQAAAALATQKSEVAAAIAQVSLTQSQTITALTLEVSNLKTNLTASITTTETNLINRADQLAQNVTDITNQLTQDKAAFTQEIQDALVYLENEAAVASALRTPRTISLTGGATGSVSFDGSANVSIATTVTGLGAANGIATLDANGQVPSTQLPSYVDDVLEYVNVAAFPTIGETGKIYVETIGNTTYRWSGSAYVKITSGEVASVAGKTGVVNLSKADVGLDNVDNTPDAQKPISEATQLALNNKVNKADVITIEKGGTGATTLEGVRANLRIGSVPLPAGTDLNDVTNEGNYHCSLNADSASMLNCPLPYAFTLQTYLTAGIVQRITYYHDADMLSYRRAMYQGQWRSWDRELSENYPSETIELKVLTETSNDALIRKLTKGAKSGFFFNASSGTSFNRYSTGFYASLHAGGFTAVACDVVTGDLKTLSAVHRAGVNGNIEFIRSKTMLAKGEYGIGDTITSLGNIGIDSTGSNPDLRTGMYEAYDIIGSFVALNSVYGTLLIGGSTYKGSAPQYAYYNSSRGNTQLRESAVHTFKTTQNTWVDGNGFIKAASPIVELYANEIKLNNEAKDQDIVFEKVDVGSYLLKGTTGLAQDGWYIEQPKDANGNIFHAVEYGTHDNGDIWLKTYAQITEGTNIVADRNIPVDIKEDRFITIRLNELPKDPTAPHNPSIIDSKGNPAPSKYHELEEGVWVISDENVAILEQERLAAMKPLKRRQFRLTLAMNGYDLKEIEALIDHIEDPIQRTIAQIEWQDATDFERTNPTLLMVAEMLQLTSEQIDQLWSYGLAL